MLIYLLSVFDFEFADASMMEKDYPLAHLGQSKKQPIEVKVSLRQAWDKKIEFDTLHVISARYID